MKATVQNLRDLYAPRTRTAITGWIPLDVFNAAEKELRPEMRAKGLRVHYRGPRRRSDSSRTYRADATHAVIYFA